MTDSRPRSGRFSLLALAALGAAAAWGTLEGLAGGRASDPSVLIVALFAVLVTVSENLALKFPSRVTVSPQLVLVMSAIVALGQHGAVLGALIIGGAGGLVLRALRSRRFTPVCFNVGQMALSAGVAATVYRSVIDAGGLDVVAGALTVSVYILTNYTLAILGASLRSGESMRSIWPNARASAPSDVIFGVVGLLLGYLYRHVGPLALLVIVAPTVVARTVFTYAVRFRQAHHRLGLLYGFTREIEQSRERTEVISSALDQFRSLLNVAVAELASSGPAGWRRTTLGPGTGKATVADMTEEATTLLREAVADGPRSGATAVVAIGADGQPEPPAETMAAPLLVDGELIGVVTVAHPVDDRRFDDEDLRLLEAMANHAAVRLDHTRLLEQVRHDAQHDRLTGLPNRSRFVEILAEVETGCSVLLVDLDRFKEINDTLGHAYGDLLLTAVGERISIEVAHKGLVARLGGDEFGVLLPHTTGGDAAQCAVSVLAALEQPFSVGDLTLEITGSVGVAASEDGGDTSRLLQQADVAMYTAKAAHSGWEMYAPERDHYSPRRLALATELRNAIDSGELEVHYQPKADLATGDIVGVEALVRWRHQHYGLLSPDVFVPLAEHVGLIRPLTLMVLHTAIEEQHRLHDLGFDIDMAVNLSVRSVLDVNLPDQVAEVLEAHGMRAGGLTLEITEGSVMADPARTIGILGRLDALGVRISVDDFGTGYSSLSYLKRLPVKEIKIDRAFISSMLSDESDAAIVRSTVDLARNLGLRAVAEGVEDRSTWSQLGLLGCDQAQGFYVSAPLDAAALGVWLRRSAARVDPFL